MSLKNARENYKKFKRNFTIVEETSCIGRNPVENCAKPSKNAGNCVAKRRRKGLFGANNLCYNKHSPNRDAH
jgi:hypothetical protein